MRLRQGKGLSFDLWAMLSASLVLAPFVFLRWAMTRARGLGLTALYGLYLVVVIT